MKVKISIEQTIDINYGMSNDTRFEMYGPADMSNEDKVDYLVTRFVKDVHMLVKDDIVLEQIVVKYIED